MMKGLVKNAWDDRDSSAGRLLAETLDAHAAPAPDGVCLDADTLAAWADDALGAQERATAEAHAASCARCQTLLAVMAKTAPPPAVERSAWGISTLRWLIPLTTAAAAVVVWTITPSRETLPAGDEPVPAVSQTASSQSPIPAPQVEPDAQLQERAARFRAPADSAAPRPTPPARANATADQVDARALDKTEGLRSKALEESAKVGGETRAAAPPQFAAEAGAAGAPPLAAAAPPSPAAAARAAAAAGAPAPAAQQPARPLPATAESVMAYARRDAVGGTIIVSTNPGSRWRILPDGLVQRSADGGASWRTEQTGVTVTLTAGASPSPSVCWLVGPAGTVLLSTDGRSWQRLAFPVATNLIAVRAIDDTSATVTAADGRTFSTTDGGRTWMPGS